MVKVITRLAAKDDPIFTGRLTISSGGLRKESKKLTKTSAEDTAGQSTEKSTPLTKEGGAP